MKKHKQIDRLRNPVNTIKPYTALTLSYQNNDHILGKFSDTTAIRVSEAVSVYEALIF